ncbi:hypothetical protein BJ741DRAFT_591825 [Chytriomyces cf. hyalinus JEL632]|nr:hypothetical protein BJ741DRAFT_591825 [Chytriomyces cf. hyalinus JEL632]
MRDNNVYSDALPLNPPCRWPGILTLCSAISCSHIVIFPDDILWRERSRPSLLSDDTEFLTPAPTPPFVRLKRDCWRILPSSPHARSFSSDSSTAGVDDPSCRPSFLNCIDRTVFANEQPSRIHNRSATLCHNFILNVSNATPSLSTLPGNGDMMSISSRRSA